MVDTMLSDDEILRRLELVRRTPWSKRLGKGNLEAITIRGIARMAGLTRTYLYKLLEKSEVIGPITRQRLTEVFGCLDEMQKRASVPPRPPMLVFGPDLPVFGVKKALDALR